MFHWNNMKLVIPNNKTYNFAARLELHNLSGMTHFYFYYWVSIRFQYLTQFIEKQGTTMLTDCQYRGGL